MQEWSNGILALTDLSFVVLSSVSDPVDRSGP